MPSYVICLFVLEPGMSRLGYNWLHILYLLYVLYELACLISELTHARIIAMSLSSVCCMFVDKRVGTTSAHLYVAMV